MTDSTIDALLVFPPIYCEHEAGLIDEDLHRDSNHLFEYPQGLISIAGYLQSAAGGKKTYSARVLHLDAHILHGSEEGVDPLSMRPEELELLACRITADVVERLKPRFVGISAQYYISEPFALVLASYLREKFGETIAIALGGQEVSFYDSEHQSSTDNTLLSDHTYIDLVVRKEGEVTTQRVLECIDSGESLEGVLGISYRDGDRILVNPDRPRVNLADLPSLDNGVVLLPDGLSLPEFLSNTNVNLVFMRGCPHGRCAFCTSGSWWGVLDGPENGVAAELPKFMSSCEQTLRELLDNGVRDLQLLDEDLNSYHSYFTSLCAMLERLHEEYGLTIMAETRPDRVNRADLQLMKRTGINRLFVGLESGSVRVLRRMNKNIRTPLLSDKEIVDLVKGKCLGFESLQPQIQQMICACYLIKEAGFHLGIFMMTGHPGSDAEAERSSRELIRLLYESHILDSEDMVETVVYMPLRGTRARHYPEVAVEIHDKRHWGRVSGHAVCKLIDPCTGETVFSREQIEQAFGDMNDLVAHYQGRGRRSC